MKITQSNKARYLSVGLTLIILVLAITAAIPYLEENSSMYVKGVYSKNSCYHASEAPKSIKHPVFFKSMDSCCMSYSVPDAEKCKEKADKPVDALPKQS